MIAGPVLKGTAPRTGQNHIGQQHRRSGGQSAAALNTTTEVERSTAAAAPTTTGERRLGSTVASLGDPSQPGFWVKTPLVQSETDGRIVNPANGKSAKVRLIPLGGAGGGGQVSLPALQLIRVSLTDLPLIEEFIRADPAAARPRAGQGVSAARHAPRASRRAADRAWTDRAATSRWPSG